MFGNSVVNLKQLIFDYFDEYYKTKLRKKFNNYNFCINSSNRFKYYSINNVKIYRTCTITTKFRKCKIDSKFGDSMESSLIQNRDCMMARLFVRVCINVLKNKNKNKHQTENENKCEHSNDNNEDDMNDSQSINSSIIFNAVMNELENKDKNTKNNKSQKKPKYFNLFVASPFNFKHLSSIKYFRIDNKRIY